MEITIWSAAKSEKIGFSSTWVVAKSESIGCSGWEFAIWSAAKSEKIGFSSIWVVAKSECGNYSKEETIQGRKLLFSHESTTLCFR